ncbi:MAG: response regulator transcription factor [Spirochaetaceae bacterium]
MFSILLVEDDKNLQRLMAAVLRQNRYEVVTADDGQQALEVHAQTHVDLLICDVMMPRVSGYQLTRELRQANYSLPVLMVTARESIEDKRRGFVVGTDDYMVKPIDLDELLLRVSALLRRARISAERKLTLGPLVLDYDSFTATYNGTDVDLTNKEFLLLFKLLSYPKQIFTRRQLMDEIWGVDTESDERTVDVHVKRLREKFTEVPEFDIQTVRGIGYRLSRSV